MKNIQKGVSVNLLITIARCAVGWHFLYEGASKLFIENWSAKTFLANTTGLLSSFYKALADSQWIGLIDILNVYGLIVIGFLLFIGIAVRWTSLAGSILLILYYFAYPPFGPAVLTPSDGHLFIVDKLFIEAIVLLCFVASSHSGYGVDRIVQIVREYRNKRASQPSPPNQETIKMRREVLKNLVTLPVLGAMGWGASRANSYYGVDVTSGATIQIGGLSLNELEGELPKGKIGNFEISRLVMGGNLIGGWAHARDLLYASSLFKAYNTEKKVFETLMLCEAAGINTINIGFPHNSLMAKYKRETGSKIQVISQIGPRGIKREDLSKGGTSAELMGDIDEAISYGAEIIQVQGNWCDWLVRDGRLDLIAQMIDYTRKQGYVAGMGAHSVESFIACEEQGIIPDYYMKTMHHENYWSAHPRENRIPFQVDGAFSNNHDEWHDNMFCLFPERTIEFVQRSRVPVMGFKVLAAGAIAPEDGFNWAFQHGADFLCVGMFDFQVVKDVNIACDAYRKNKNRERRWY